jgi:hypothetical protein
MLAFAHALAFKTNGELQINGLQRISSSFLGKKELSKVYLIIFLLINQENQNKQVAINFNLRETMLDCNESCRSCSINVHLSVIFLKYGNEHQERVYDK